MLNDSHVTDSLPAYVLGSLEEAEARQVAEHIAGCYACRAELETFQVVADQLPLTAPVARPSAGLKPRLMGQVNGRKVKRPVWQWLRLPPRLVPVGGILALLVIAVLAVSNVALWQRLEAQSMLTGPLGMRAIALENTSAAPGASGFVIVSADGMNGVLVVDELPMLDAAKQEYQLWLVKDEEITRGNLFSVDEDGYRGLRLEAPESLATYSAVWITVEPIGGSDQPTGERVLGGSLFNP